MDDQDKAELEGLWLMERIKVSDLTEAQFRFICNGCGSKRGIFKWIRPPMGHDVYACYQHDIDSWQGGPQFYRYLAEYDFMLSLETTACMKSFFVMLWFYYRSWVFYILLRIFGRFHWAKHRRTIHDLRKIL